MLTAAGVLAIVVSLVHSVLGERLIFRRPNPLSQLGARRAGIVWASWHVVTVSGCALGILLITLGSSSAIDRHAILATIAGAMALSSLLVLVATRGRHPGWIALAAVAAMTWSSR